MSDGLYLTDEEFIAIDQKTQRLRKAMHWWRERCRAVKYWEPAAKTLAEDYEAKVAALEARCAGLERERDAIQSAHDEQMDRAGKSHKAWRESEGVVIILERELREEKQERDALQAKLTVARRSMDSILCLAVEGPDGFGSALKACQAIQKEASAALAVTTTDEGENE